MKLFARRRTPAPPWWVGSRWTPTDALPPRPATWPFVGARRTLTVATATLTGAGGIWWAYTAADADTGEAVCAAVTCHLPGLGVPVADLRPIRTHADPRIPVPAVDQCWSVDDPTGQWRSTVAARLSPALPAAAAEATRLGFDTDLLVAATAAPISAPVADRLAAHLDAVAAHLTR